MDTKQLIAAMTKEPEPLQNVPTPEMLLKTGGTLLDLAITGDRRGGFAMGKYFWIVGDSSSGKTFLSLTCLAEASINNRFADYRFIYDNAEDGALMNMERYFGPAMAGRLEPPAGTRQDPEYSGTIEDFYFNLDDAFKAEAKTDGKPFIYVLDSMDSLDSKYAEKKFQEKKTKGDKAKGDFGDGKAKFNSTRIRRVVQQLSETGCILIILSQTRDNIDAGPFDPQQTHAGGRSLKFYATVEIWSSCGAKIKRTVRGKDYVVGGHVRIQTKKNRMTGKERTVKFPIHYDTGIDDIGGMVDYLCDHKFWKRNKAGAIDCSVDLDLGVEGGIPREALIAWIYENDMRDALEEITEDAWQTIEEALRVKRPSKY